MKIGVLVGIIYIVGVVVTYIITSIMIKNPSDIERDYANTREFDFSHIGAAIAFPIFWLCIALIYVCYLFEAMSNILYRIKNKKGK